MMDKKPVQTEPSDVEVEHSAVHVRGPGGVDVSLTPQAALATAKKIEDAAVEVIIASATSANPTSS